MRLVIPEISWHETLPIYSCDLQSKTLEQDLGKLDSIQRGVPLQDISHNFNTKQEPETTQNMKKSLIEVKETNPSWTRLATCGGDNIIRLWRVDMDFKILAAKEIEERNSESKNSSSVSLSSGITFLASLKRHEKPVNVVRWSHSGRYLASGSDDSLIIIWTLRNDNHGPSATDLFFADKPDEDDNEEAKLTKEIWIPLKTLRRHLEDVYDLAWSPDDNGLISGSVDHSAILWQTDLETSENSSSVKSIIFRDAKHYVQGVAWDPLNSYFATLSCDRSLRLFSTKSKTCVRNTNKYEKQSLFQDDSWRSFFRRLTFSPDGLLLLCPSGSLENVDFAGQLTNETINPKPPQHAAHLFYRTNFNKPIISYPTGVQPVVTTRFCKRPFKLRSSGLNNSSQSRTSFLDLPYRWVFCLLLEDGVLLCDTQHPVPFAQINQIHYQALNDATWSDDGSLLIVCSTDGYCSMIYFNNQDIGQGYKGPVGTASLKNPEPSPTDSAILDPQKVEESLFFIKPQPLIENQQIVKEPENPSKKRRVPLVTLSTVPLREEPDLSSKEFYKMDSNSSEPVSLSSEKSNKRRVTLVTLSENPDDGNYKPKISKMINANPIVISKESKNQESDFDRTLGDEDINEYEPE